MNKTLKISRRKSDKIFVGNIPIGGNSPISIQSMTNTDTKDVSSTVSQIRRLEKAGADIIRISIPDSESAESLGKIKKIIDTPLIADIHFDYRLALQAAKLGADCLRINPGNIGSKERIKEVVQAADNHGIPIRIGVNGGSLEKDLLSKYKGPTPDAIVESALRNIDHLERLHFKNFKVSVKSSDVFTAILSYRLLAKKITQPLHLGVTEAGGERLGTVKSSIGLGILLSEGIGDTIRISLAADPVEEIKVGYNILRSLHLRFRGVNFIACPSCSRQNFDVISTVKNLEKRLEDVLVPLNVSIIGCVVNGPGEAKISDIGLTGGKPNLLYLSGKPSSKVINENLLDELEQRIRKMASEKIKEDKSIIIRS